jgi:hypothetical protein
VFEDILKKPTLERADLELMIEKILVYEDHIEVMLKADIDAILQGSLLPVAAGDENMPVAVGAAQNFKYDIIGSLKTQIVQVSTNRRDKVYDVNVIGNCEWLCNDTRNFRDIGIYSNLNISFSPKIFTL